MSESNGSFEKEYPLEEDTNLVHTVGKYPIWGKYQKKDLKIDFKSVPNYVQYIEKRKEASTESWWSLSNLFGASYFVLIGIFGLILLLTTVEPFFLHFDTLKEGSLPEELIIEGSFIEDLPETLRLPYFLATFFIVSSTGFALCLLFLKYLRGDYLNFYRPRAAEEYLAAVIAKTVAITKKKVEYYVKAEEKGKGDKKHIAYQLKTIDPDWDLELCLKPFMQMPSILRISGAVALLGWSLITAISGIQMFISGEEDLIGLILLFAMIGAPAAIAGLILAWNQIVEVSISLRKYNCIRRDLIEKQGKRLIHLDAQETSAPSAIETKLDLLNARWTLQHLQNSPKLPLSGYFKAWSLLGVVFTLAGFFL